MQTEQPNYALRPYCEEDYQAIAKLIAQTWEFDTFCTPQVAKLLSYVYLDECLVEQNFAQVAICNNQIAGIIMGNSFCDHCALKQDQLRLAHNQEALNSTLEGREVSSFFRVDVSYFSIALL